MNSVPNVIWTQVFSASIAAAYISYAAGHIQKGKKKKKLQLENSEFREIAMDKVIKLKLDF